MTVSAGIPPPQAPPARMPRRAILRLLAAGLLGLGAALLVSCGGSSGNLIPLANAGPLQGDFEEVAQAAQNAGGNCSATEAAILKTEQDFAALPSTIDAGLRNTLRQGISNLRSRALVLCAQPLSQTTSTNATPKTTTSTRTTPTTTATTPTTTPTVTSTTPTAPAPSGPGGGTPAPGVGEAQPEGSGQGSGGGGQGSGGGHGGGTEVGEGAAGPGGAPGAAGAQEGGK